MKDIVENLEYAWNYYYISRNTNLTEKFIRKNISKLKSLTSNELFSKKLNILEKKYDNLIKYLCKEFIYNISVKMLNSKIKTHYYRKDLKLY